MQIQDRPPSLPTDASRWHWLMSYPFRIFFLSLGVMAIAIIPLWWSILFHWIQPALAVTPAVWHAHEMLFGWVPAAIAGFLLTAVCVWTGTIRLHGWPLVGLWSVWLAGRIVLLFGSSLPFWLVAGIELAFLPLVAWDAGRRIYAKKQSRHLIILVVLTVYWLFQAGLLVTQQLRFAHAALTLLCVLMLVIGGRITPSFSYNWLRMKQQLAPNEAQIQPIPALEKALIAGGMALAASMLMPMLVSVPLLSAGLAAVLGVLSGVRVIRWQGWRIRQEPLLWILHLPQLMISAGWLVMAGGLLGWWSPLIWIHLIAIGAAAALILGVISRVSLGHTGRPLHLPSGMTLAFFLIVLCALIRVLTAASGLPWTVGIALSMGLWVMAFGLYCWRYAGILSSPRPDGLA